MKDGHKKASRGRPLQHYSHVLQRDDTVVAGESSQFSVEHLRGGWTLLSNGRIGTVSASIVLTRGKTGVALFELEPTWTPDMVEKFRRQLDITGFTAAFPGYLPVIHRRLRTDDIPHLEVILDEGFTFQNPISLPSDGRWCAALQALLTPPPAPPAVAPQPPRQGSSGLRRAALPAALTLTLAGVVAAFLVPSPWPGSSATVPPPIVLALAEDAPSLPFRDDATAPAASLPAAPEAVPAGDPAPELADAVDAALAGMPVPDPEAPSMPPEQAPVPHAAPSGMDPAPAMASSPEPAEAPAAAGPPTTPLPDTAPDPVMAPDQAAPAQQEAAPPPDTAQPVPAEPPATTEPPPVTADPVPAETPAAAEPAPAAPPAEPPAAAREPAAAAPAPVVVAPAPIVVTPPPAVAAPPAAPAPRPSDPRLNATLLRRGTELLALGDISGARRFLERAANNGDAEAARLMAETHDPHTLSQLRTRGLQPDPAAALRWYRRAAALGAAVDRPIAVLEAAP